MRKSARTVGAIAAWLAGCTRVDGAAVAKFPTPSELRAFAHEPSDDHAALEVAADQRWQIQEDALVTGDGYPEADDWDALTLAAVHEHGNVRAAPELRCAAREVARFFVQRGAYPEETLREFLVERCGSSAAQTRVSVVSAALGEEADLPRVTAELRIKAKGLLADAMAGPAADVALAFAWSPERAVVVALSAPRSVALSPPVEIEDGAALSVEGQLLVPSAFVDGWVTLGSFDAGLCEADSGLALPRFRLRCPLLTSDPWARVEIVIGNRETASNHVVARVLWPGQARAARDYESSPAAPVASAHSSAAWRTALIDGINARRRALGRSALKFEAAQSAQNEALSARYSAALRSGESTTPGIIERGLLAGWNVRGTIRNAAFCALSSETALSPERLLADGLRSPLTRGALLGTVVERVAIGVGSATTRGRSALITTYGLFGSPEHEADEQAVYARLTELQRANGFAPSERIGSDPALKDALSRVAARTQSSEQALEYAITSIGADVGTRVFGTVLESSDLRHLTLPERFVRRSGPIELGITHYRARGAAWGQYVLMLIALETSGLRAR